MVVAKNGRLSTTQTSYTVATKARFLPPNTFEQSIMFAREGKVGLANYGSGYQSAYDSKKLAIVPSLVSSFIEGRVPGVTADFWTSKLQDKMLGNYYDGIIEKNGF